MTIGRLKRRRQFKPTGKGGGSKKGKVQNYWPLFVLVAADALCVRIAGSMEALLRDRDWVGFGLDNRGDFLCREMVRLFPGIWIWLGQVRQPTITSSWRLLHNRVYKQYYSGSSDRGSGHDPRTRAAMSREHWLRKAPEGSSLVKLHEDIVSGAVTCVDDWFERYVGGLL